MTDRFEIRVGKGKTFSKLSDARRYAMRYIPVAPIGDGKVTVYDRGHPIGKVWYDGRREMFVWTDTKGRTQVLDRRGIQNGVRLC